MCVKWIRLDSLDGIPSMSKACLTWWRNLTCIIDFESHADVSAASASVFIAGHVLTEVSDSDIYPSPKGWAVEYGGWHQHLLKTQLARNSDNGGTVAPKLAETPLQKEEDALCSYCFTESLNRLCREDRQGCFCRPTDIVISVGSLKCIKFSRFSGCPHASRCSGVRWHAILVR